MVNRAAQTVSEVSDIDIGDPSVTATYNVGSEPGTSPSLRRARRPTSRTGRTGTLSVIDTASGTVTKIDLGGAPMAVCVTNDTDDVDSDETIYVTDFYSRPNGTQGGHRHRARRPCLRRERRDERGHQHHAAADHNQSTRRDDRRRQHR